MPPITGPEPKLGLEGRCRADSWVFRGVSLRIILGMFLLVVKDS